MSEFEDRINSILGNPAEMEKIMKKMIGINIHCIMILL